MVNSRKTSVTILDVARMAHVSPSTVTHALNGKRPVSAETKERISLAIKESGYVPSWNASRLKGSGTGIIGCLAMDITETFVNQIVKGIEQGISGGQETLLFVSAVEFNNDFSKAFEFMFSHHVDGIILCHHIPNGMSKTISVPEGCSIPIISINMDLDNFVSIVPNNFQGGYLAADHLYSSGMRHPAVICGPKERASVENRVAGFIQRLKELKLGIPEDFHYGEYDFDHGYSSAKEIFSHDSEVDGVFAGNDYIAAGTLTALKELGKRVPEEVRVVGFDNRDFSGFWSPSITTFQQPLQEMGLVGISVLHTMISSGNAGQRCYVLEPRLIARKSTLGDING